MFFFVNFLHLHFARRHPCQKLSSGSFSKWLGEPVASSKLHASWCLRTPDTVISHFMHFMWFVWFVWFDKFDFGCFCFASGRFTCILWFYACWYSTTLMNCTTYLHIATWSHATGPGRNHWPRVCSAGFGPCPRSLQSNWNSQHVSWIWTFLWSLEVYLQCTKQSAICKSCCSQVARGTRSGHCPSFSSSVGWSRQKAKANAKAFQCHLHGTSFMIHHSSSSTSST